MKNKTMQTLLGNCYKTLSLIGSIGGVKNTCGGKNKKNKKRSQIGTNVRVRVFNAGLLARSHFASGESCYLPTQSRFSVFFRGSRPNAELVPKFHVALYASHAVLPTVTKNFALN
jgi:hypothetical protein